jgi:glycosyltransferase involved in cell wall biosynthesis
MMESVAEAQVRPAKKLLVCKSTLLPYSETFIKSQVLAYSSWSPVLVGTEKLAAGLPLDGIEVRILKSCAPNVLGRVQRKVLRQLGMAAPGSVEQLRREGASLVQVHFATEALEYWPVIRHLELPVVVTLHGFDINTYKEWWENEGATASERRYPARLLALARQDQVHFVAVSEAIKQRAIEFGIPADRITVHYIGIDLTQFQQSGRPIAQRGPRILYVGRLVEKKGGEFLIRAFRLIRSSLPDAELVMAGAGPLLHELQGLAKELNVPVSFLGSVTSAEVRRQMEMARVFCLPSITAKNGDAEGLGIVILEAQACGLPVVTSAMGGATEGIVDGVTGYAFPEKDVQSMSNHLMSLLRDDRLAESMSRAAPAFIASRFDIRRCTRSLEDLYERRVAGM